MEKFTVKWHYHGIDYDFHTLDSLFSYKQVDIGTQQMIEHIELQSGSKVLDLGCGYGNPPYHTDFSVAKSFIEGSYKHLQMDGWLVIETKRFDWYKNKIYHSAFFGHTFPHSIQRIHSVPFLRLLELSVTSTFIGHTRLHFPQEIHRSLLHLIRSSEK